jgi:hypothetical protein
MSGPLKGIELTAGQRLAAQEWQIDADAITLLVGRIARA